MKEWFDSLDPRERKVVTIGAIMLLLLSVYFLAWEPFSSKLDKLRKSSVANERTLSWMKQTSLEVKRLQRNSGGPKNLSGQSLLGLIDKTAKQHKLADAIKRVQPDGKTKALVRLESASFNNMILWLEQLQLRQGIEIVSSDIERQEQPGLVNARLILESPG